MKNDRFVLILETTCHFCALCFFEGDTKEIIRRNLSFLPFGNPSGDFALLFRERKLF